jgi:hypothetical protein
LAVSHEPLRTPLPCIYTSAAHACRHLVPAFLFHDEDDVNLLSGNYLFNTPTDSPSGYFMALTIGFGVLFVASAIAYWRRSKLAPRNPILRRFIRRVSSAGMWCAGIGLFLAGMRYAGLDYLGMPIWMLILICVMILLVGYYVYDLSERYPVAVWRLRESSLERRFRPAPKPKLEPQRVRPAGQRGKRRR